MQPKILWRGDFFHLLKLQEVEDEIFPFIADRAIVVSFAEALEDGG
ncbi:MAG: hypothetical protein AB4080_16175 [Trichodesmium sp.]